MYLCHCKIFLFVRFEGWDKSSVLFLINQSPIQLVGCLLSLPLFSFQFLSGFFLLYLQFVFFVCFLIFFFNVVLFSSCVRRSGANGFFHCPRENLDILSHYILYSRRCFREDVQTCLIQKTVYGHCNRYHYDFHLFDS